MEARGTRLGQTRETVARASVRRFLRLFEGEIGQIEDRIGALIQSSAVLRGRADLLRSVPGVGPVSATTLLVELPELGQLTPSQAPKQVIIAVARKLLVILNAMVRDNRPFSAQM